jgi:hypothetical protein
VREQAKNFWKMRPFERPTWGYEMIIAKLTLQNIQSKMRRIFSKKLLYTAILIAPKVVIPAPAGRQERRNPGKHWIPGQARNDKLHRTYIVIYN